MASIDIDQDEIAHFYFHTAEDAAMAYDCYARKLFGESNTINFSDSSRRLTEEQVEERRIFPPFGSGAKYALSSYGLNDDLTSVGGVHSPIVEALQFDEGDAVAQVSPLLSPSQFCKENRTSIPGISSSISPGAKDWQSIASCRVRKNLAADELDGTDSGGALSDNKGSPPRQSLAFAGRRNAPGESAREHRRGPPRTSRQSDHRRRQPPWPSPPPPRGGSEIRCA